MLVPTKENKLLCSRNLTQISSMSSLVTVRAGVVYKEQNDKRSIQRHDQDPKYDIFAGRAATELGIVANASTKKREAQNTQSSPINAAACRLYFDACKRARHTPTCDEGSTPHI